MQFRQIGEDVCGPVYAGFRSIDYVPVAIKYVKGPHVPYEMNAYKIPVEVALMHKVAGGPESVGNFSTVSLLDWYYLDQQLILITERPVPSQNLTTYLDSQGGVIEEQEAKTFLNQLVDATDEMHRKGVFHRDIKSENILVEIGSSVPRVRLMNFGCGSFVQERPHHTFSGTLACAPPEWYVRGEYKAGPTTVWQLGALLYRLLHGFRNSTMGILCGKMQLSRDSATQLSQDCLDFLQLCLKKNPDERATLQQLQLHPWLN
ncbi:serine/threonine-protein kinase pim-2-like [Thunnus maccoyii]|uniref:serine/threonine-protein kinase pim-2-like n=1 Tax=Thunnus maccoyii TaxID=8240 RepID=UPI001C4AF78B|nr:serine/threonine-protein kinase pim-2-like [Thunnus maccoyii]